MKTISRRIEAKEEYISGKNRGTGKEKN